MRTLTVSHSRRTVFQAVKKAGANLDLSVESSDVTKGRLLLYASGGLLSFGNKISVRIIKKDDKSIVKISSRSAAPVQIIDWGTNKGLERDLIAELKDVLSR